MFNLFFHLGKSEILLKSNVLKSKNYCTVTVVIIQHRPQLEDLTHLSRAGSLSDIWHTHVSIATVQVNFCQKLLFLHQLTHTQWCFGMKLVKNVTIFLSLSIVITTKEYTKDLTGSYYNLNVPKFLICQPKCADFVFNFEQFCKI